MGQRNILKELASGILWNLAPLLPVHRLGGYEHDPRHCLDHNFIGRTADFPVQHAPTTCPHNKHHVVAPPEHDSFFKAQIVTLRVHRMWIHKLKMRRRAYQTKISNSRREVTGRGSSPEASQQAAERQWVELASGVKHF